MVPKPNTYKLQSNSLMFMPGMLAYWKNMFRHKTERQLAFWQCAMGFSTLPAALIHDLLDGTIEYKITGKGNDVVEFQWAGPMKDVSFYIPDQQRPLHESDEPAEYAVPKRQG